MFEALNKNSNKKVVVYAVQQIDGDTEFLIYSSYGWVWFSSSHFEPIK